MYTCICYCKCTVLLHFSLTCFIYYFVLGLFSRGKSQILRLAASIQLLCDFIKEMETQDNENTEKQSEKEKEISTNETVIQSEQSTIPGTNEEDIEPWAIPKAQKNLQLVTIKFQLKPSRSPLQLSNVL